MGITKSTEVYVKIAKGIIPTIEELSYETEGLGKLEVLEIASGVYQYKDVFYAMCDNLHSNCFGCPVNELMSDDERESNECTVFKDGTKIRKFILTRSKNLIKG